MTSKKYQALLIVGFGGPEGIDDVMPFLENVLRGKRIPEERKLEVAEQYKMFGGISPINGQNRELKKKLEKAIQKEGLNLKVYWGNRNWKPYLADEISRMKAEGVTKALAYMTSAYSSYSGCRQYRENIANAQDEAGPGAPEIDKLRVFFNHPLFIESHRKKIEKAMEGWGSAELSDSRLLFTAHSLPVSMSENCDYVAQLKEASHLVYEKLSRKPPKWDLVYQSRSGPPQQQWLEPDICDHIKRLKEDGVDRVIVSPIGFVSDHMEILFDLDIKAKEVAESLEMKFARAETPGNSSEMIALIIELIKERMGIQKEKRAIGKKPPSHDICPEDCCLYEPIIRKT